MKVVVLKMEKYLVRLIALVLTLLGTNNDLFAGRSKEETNDPNKGQRPPLKVAKTAPDEEDFLEDVYAAVDAAADKYYAQKSPQNPNAHTIIQDHTVSSSPAVLLDDNFFDADELPF